MTSHKLSKWAQSMQHNAFLTFTMCQIMTAYELLISRRTVNVLCNYDVNFLVGKFVWAGVN